MQRQKTDILLLYFYREPFGPTVQEHIESFERYSQFGVKSLNLCHPDSTEILRKISPQAIVMHYTLFGLQYYLITEEQAWVVGESPAIKVAFFQDEYNQFQKRCRFIDEYEIDIVYTLIEPQYHRDTYYHYCKSPIIMHTLAGYVSDNLIAVADNIRKKKMIRDIDVGYRGHELDIIYGLGGQEKKNIGEEFKKRTYGKGLNLDIETAVGKRIYGDEWYIFISRCRAMLGVEAGVSVFDIHDTIRLKAKKIRRKNPEIEDQELWKQIIAPHENNIHYRTISPRHFEAAALNTTQILFEGTYTGILEPWQHYFPLQKDFSNLDEILTAMEDKTVLNQIAANAKKDLIDSGLYHYRQFVAQVDQQLRLAGLKPMLKGRTI